METEKRDFRLFSLVYFLWKNKHEYRSGNAVDETEIVNRRTYFPWKIEFYVSAHGKELP